MFPAIAFRDWHRRRSSQTEWDLVSTSLNRPGGRSGSILPAHLEGLAHPDDGAPVREMVAEEYGVSIDNVAVTGRCQHANFLVAAAMRDLSVSAGSAKGRRALVETPAYEPLGLTPDGFGFTVDRFERRLDDTYALDPARVAEAMTDETTFVVVTNRHNPSGRRMEYGRLEELADVVSDHDAHLMVDEVFSPFVTQTPDAPRTAFGGATAAGLPNTVVTNSLTKFHGLYDVNIGWVIAGKRIVDRVNRIEDHTNVVARPNREMARRALSHTDRFLEESRRMLREKNDLLASFVADRDDIDAFVPEGHIFALLDHEHADGDVVDQAAIEEGVWVFPGRFFGEPDRFRVSLGHGMTECREGLDRLATALDGL